MTANAVALSLPRISIVTPSFNQAAFLEETIRSVLEQNYPNLEYVIVDGGSTDGSVEIIKQYANRLTCEIMGWLNSDDKYLPWTFATLGDVLTALPQVEWLTSLFHFFWDKQGRAVSCEAHPGFSSELILSGGTLLGSAWPSWAFMQQESTFWRRSLWNRAGGRIDTRWPLAGDFDLWMRFARLAQLYTVPVPLAGFRRHDQQKTARQMPDYLREARDSFAAQGGRAPGWFRGWCLKNTGKLLRFLQRRHASAATQQGIANRCVLSEKGAGWELKKY
jgi:hypothetical protein